jgi:hypothetical protein
MRSKSYVLLGIVFVVVVIGAVSIYKWEAIEWRAHEMRGWFLDQFAPKGDTLPTAEVAVSEPSVASAEVTPRATLQPEFETRPTLPPVTPSPVPTDLPTATPIPLVEPPSAVTLDPPQWEKQTINNCGPATLTMYMRYFGWTGTQAEIADVVHPNTIDKNVRWDELVYYVKTHAGWLDALFRVGGTIEKMKLFLANDYPVIIETGYEIPSTGWVGHYLLLTGYDDEEGVFIVQDATAGANQKVSYEKIDEYWQQFNRLYIVVYRPENIDKVNAMLGEDADEDANRELALVEAQADVAADPDNAFAYFNLGSNLNYFDRYPEAAAAYDKARELGLPKRMLFYQFGPYRAYFNQARYQDVIELSSYTLDYRPDLEESYFWRGWAEYMLGNQTDAIEDWRSALDVNPTFNDAKTALSSVGATP